MANIAIYHDSILSGGSILSATNVDANSNVSYLSDQRLSYKFITDTTSTTVSIDQPDDNDRNFTDIILVDHNMNGGNMVVRSFTAADRTGLTTELNTPITAADPLIVSLGPLTNTQFIDVFLSVPAGTIRLGELMLPTKLTSPQRPGIGIRTDYVPRTTHITMPNGERAAIKHAETSRRKSYVIPGLTVTESEQLSGLFLVNEGSQMVVLDDERDETYPALMDTSLEVNDESKIVNVRLVFEEQKL